MKQVAIKKAINSLLKGRYPEHKVYGKEVREGYQAPCFFTEILDKGEKAGSKNYSSGGFTLLITYFQKKINELDQLEMVDEIQDLFGLTFVVGTRILTVGEYSYDFVGEYSDILQISIEFDYKSYTGQPETGEKMEQINLRHRKGE